MSLEDVYLSVPMVMPAGPLDMTPCGGTKPPTATNTTTTTTSSSTSTTMTTTPSPTDAFNSTDQDSNVTYPDFNGTSSTTPTTTGISTTLEDSDSSSEKHTYRVEILGLVIGVGIFVNSM